MTCAAHQGLAAQGLVATVFESFVNRYNGFEGLPILPQCSTAIGRAAYSNMSSAQISCRDRAHVVAVSSMQPFDDKENQEPLAGGASHGTYPTPSPAQTDAVDLKINRKPWRKTPSQPSRPVLRDITPLFKRTAVSRLPYHGCVPPPPPPPPPLPVRPPPTNTVLALDCRLSKAAFARTSMHSSPPRTGWSGTVPVWSWCGPELWRLAAMTGTRGMQGFFSDDNVMHDAETEPMLDGGERKQKQVSHARAG